MAPLESDIKVTVSFSGSSVNKNKTFFFLAEVFLVSVSRFSDDSHPLAELLNYSAVIMKVNVAYQ